MEYAWGYAAASLSPPFPYTNRRKPPARANSAKVSSRRHRTPGRSRALSSSSHTNNEDGGGSGGGNSNSNSNSNSNNHHHHNSGSSNNDNDNGNGNGSNSGQKQPRQLLRAPAAQPGYQSKQLPATPRPDEHRGGRDGPHDADEARRSAIGVAISPGLAPPTSSPAAPPPPRPPRSAGAPNVASQQHRHAPITTPPTMSAPYLRTESLTSSAATTMSSRTTMASSEQASSAAGGSTVSLARQPKPFIVRNGRTYLSDPTLTYPLPVDLPELHRQSMRTLLTFQLFGGPICSPDFASKPPGRVLDAGCGTGFWSMMCHRYYARHGHANISFVGLDLAPLGCGASTSVGSGADQAPSRGSGSSPASTGDWQPDKDMKWQFVQHDLRRTPLPFPDDDFDFIMIKDLALSCPGPLHQALVDEFLRILKPGGTMEAWDGDYSIRMLRPHVPEPTTGGSSTSHPASAGHVDVDDHEAARGVGAYVLTASTPLSAPLNTYLVEYNGWVTKAFEQRGLPTVPCALAGPILVQEPGLTGLGSRRMAVPLSEVRWEREGVGGVITKDGKSYIETKGKKSWEPDPSRRTLTAAQAAVRRTALLSVVQMVQSLEPILREVSGKSQDEWDAWLGKMANDLLKEEGTSWGECLELGAWWARKKA